MELSPSVIEEGSQAHFCLPEEEWPLVMDSLRKQTAALPQKPKVGKAKAKWELALWEQRMVGKRQYGGSRAGLGTAWRAFRST